MKYSSRYLIILIAILTTFTSCLKTQIDHRYDGENRIYATFTSNKSQSVSLLSCSTQKDSLLIDLTTRLKEDAEIEFTSDLTNLSDYISIEPQKLIIPAGQRSGIFKFNVLKKGKNVEYDTNVNLRIYSDKNKELIDTVVEVTLLHLYEIKITPEQQEMLDYYKSQYDLDLMQLIGKWECNGQTCTYLNEDGDLDKPNAPINLTEQFTFLTLSPLATKERPILQMERNAFGLNYFYKKLYRDITVDNPFFYYKENPTWVPSPYKIMNTINFTQTSKENYNVAYYTLEIDPKTKDIKKPYLMNIRQILKLPNVDPINDIVLMPNVKHLKGRPDMIADDDKQFVIYLSEDELYKVFFPLVFQFTPWERAIQYQKDHPSTSEDDNSFAFAVKTGSFSPYQMLYYSTADVDGWKGERDGQPTNFIEPIFKLNFDKKQIYLQFSSDAGTLSCGYNWVKINMKKVDE